MKLFKELTPDEILESKKWARENYQLLDDINGAWHPVVQAECVLMNAEAHLIQGQEETEQNKREAQEAIRQVLEMGVN